MLLKRGAWGPEHAVVDGERRDMLDEVFLCVFCVVLDAEVTAQVCGMVGMRAGQRSRALVPYLIFFCLPPQGSWPDLRNPDELLLEHARLVVF